MSHKKQLIGLDFERKATLLAPVLASESVSGVSVAPDGSLLFDGVQPTHSVFARLNGQWRSLLSTANLSADINFNNAGGFLATRETIRLYVESVLTSVGGTFQGSWDASAGTVPSGAGIKAGDSWRISVGGTLPGLPGATTEVEPGDLIVASVDNPSGPAQFFALQTNISDSSQIIVGGTFTPVSGAITGADSVRTALQKLANQVNSVAPNALAGSGLTFNSTTGRIDLGGNLTGFTEFYSNTINDSRFYVELEKTDSNTSILIDAKTSSNLGLVNFETQGFNRGTLISSVSQSSYAQTEIRTYNATAEYSFSVRNNGYYLNSTDGIYALPPIGLTFTLAVDNSGKILFRDSAALTTNIKFTQTITGDATASSFRVTHSKNTKDVVVQVFDVNTDDEVDVSISRTTVNAVDIIFSAPPALGKQYRVVVI